MFLYLFFSLDRLFHLGLRYFYWNFAKAHIVLKGVKQLYKCFIFQYFFLWFLSNLLLSFDCRVSYWPYGVIFCYEKWNQTYNNWSDGPNWIPTLRVIVWYAQTYPGICLKSAGFSSHHYSWWLPRIICWKNQFAHIISTLVLVGEIKNHKMPCKNIVGLRGSNKIFCYLPVFGFFNMLLQLLSQNFILFLESHSAGFWHFF